MRRERSTKSNWKSPSSFRLTTRIESKKEVSLLSLKLSHLQKELQTKVEECRAESEGKEAELARKLAECKEKVSVMHIVEQTVGRGCASEG